LNRDFAPVDIAPGYDPAACGNLSLTEKPSGNQSLDGVVSAKLFLADGSSGLSHGFKGHIPLIVSYRCSNHNCTRLAKPTRSTGHTRIKV